MSSTHPDWSAFLRSIIDRPDDDLPRLVAADWLDEHGDPERAEFVRVQCELAKLPPAHVEVTERCVLERRYGPDYYALTGGEGTQNGPVIMRVKVGDRVDVLRPTNNKGKPMYGLRVHRITDDEVILVNDAKSGPWAGQALRRREGELLTDGRWLDWAGPLPQLAGYAWPNFDGPWHWDFTRGFVSAVTLSWADWVRHAAALLAAAPLRRVNRPRRCDECRGFGFYGQNDCLYCRGTGRVDDWAGDGLVRLTTWPQMEPLDGPRNLSEPGAWRVRIVGGTTEDVLPTDEWPLGDYDPATGLRTAPTLRRLLALEYSGVRFELPAARGPTWDVSALAADEEVDRAARHLRPGVAYRTTLTAHADPAPAFFRTTPEARP
jgi:uncharacterized protein (TIGR02996 family)